MKRSPIQFIKTLFKVIPVFNKIIIIMYYNILTVFCLAIIYTFLEEIVRKMKSYNSKVINYLFGIITIIVIYGVSVNNDYPGIQIMLILIYSKYAYMNYVINE